MFKRILPVAEINLQEKHFLNTRETVVDSNSNHLGLCSLSRSSLITSHLRLLLAINTLQVIFLSYKIVSALKLPLIFLYIQHQLRS